MSYVLKRIQHLKSASNETECYTANVYYQNKLIGTVVNCGNGGGTDFNIIEGADISAFGDWAINFLKNNDQDCSYIKSRINDWENNQECYEPIGMWADSVLEDYLEARENAKERRKLAKSVCFRLKSGNYREYYISGQDYSADGLSAYIERLEKKYGNNEFVILTPELFDDIGWGVYDYTFKHVFRRAQILKLNA